MKEIVLLSEEKIVSHIYLIRGKKVMLDRDLARMYGVATGHLNRAVKRNARRFPDDFMFQLSVVEKESLESQFVISKPVKKSECQTGIPKAKKGGAWSLPYVFTEQGVAMLSSVLNSNTAIDVNIQIIQVFTRMREVLLSQKDILLKIENLEKKIMEQNEKTGKHDKEIQQVFYALKQLMQEKNGPRKKVGYKRKNESELF